MRVALGLILAVATSGTDPSCSRAAEQYQGAVAERSLALSAYRDCLSGNGEQARCSEAFTELDAAQDQVEMMFSEYEAACCSQGSKGQQPLRLAVPEM